MAKCKKCNLESDELTWDRQHHDRTGKWRLFHQGQGRPHECQKSDPEEIVVQAPNPLVKCPKCDPLSNNAWMKRESLQEHLKVEHFGFW